MAENIPTQGGHRSNEELLANAIPIDPSMLADDEEPAAASAGSGGGDDLAAIELEPVEDGDSSSDAPKRTIQTFGSKQMRHEDNWNRSPNVTGQGAIHVRTFVSKLRLDAIEYLDNQINEWLDEHPQYEVKFVTQSIGKLIGKNTEDALFVSVWV